jgi:hypothetical protein
MLISHKYRFIFVHVYKNAGTSISTALMPFAFYNSIHRYLYLIIKKKLGKFGVRVPEKLNPEPCDGHGTAAQIMQVVGRDVFKSYFTFAVVRNPWDWQVSLYNFMLKTPTHHQHEQILGFKDFREYLLWRCREEVRYQKDFIYTADDKLLVDFVGRYENLTDDFQTICNRIGIHAELPKMNVSKSKPYQEYYTPETVELVRKTFDADIRLFGYDFE